ncbi:putative DsbA family dithiol-disulfide isomerase [Duganella sp. 1224]|uniref:DsbA family oxidoreductase n=1 Tax=Duganella sp. 1224 TaxID=2587052 RepID=UPI0015C80001|nr:DsbA family oxidoreductase [Duganella sp. 1224]NYE60326.1 putative DsbA family dithiol-disulfide isomerase [Duganella sp. 1224]
MATSIDIDITSDFICPWCWIGHQHLKTALARDHVRANIRYLPFELNPGMPAEGMSRHAYRSAKFGNWARSQSMDEDVTLAGRLVDLAFHYERIGLTPNTRLAHKLMAYAQQQGDGARSARLFDAIFAAYFEHGVNIGDAKALAYLAAAQGFDAEAALAYMHGAAAETLVAAALREARERDVNSVPQLLIEGRRIAGAQTAESLGRMLRELDYHE